jgi:hypothetical protein
MSMICAIPFHFLHDAVGSPPTNDLCQQAIKLGMTVYTGIRRCPLVQNKQKIRDTRCPRFRPPINSDSTVLNGIRQQS